MKKTILITLLGVSLALVGCVQQTPTTDQDIDQSTADVSQNQNVNTPVADLNQAQVDYPQKIVAYILQSADPENECQEVSTQPDVRGISGEFCKESLRLEYINPANEDRIFVALINYTKGEDIAMEIYKKYSRLDKTLPSTLFRTEKHEFGWFPKSKYDAIIIQESYGELASGDNDVTRWFLNAYQIDEKKMNELNSL